MLRSIPEFLLVPLLLIILGASLLIAGVAVLADLTRWVSLARRAASPAWTDLFRRWPLVIFGLSAALLPDLAVRIAAGAVFVEHAALMVLFARRPQGRVLATDEGEKGEG